MNKWRMLLAFLVHISHFDLNHVQNDVKNKDFLTDSLKCTIRANKNSKIVENPEWDKENALLAYFELEKKLNCN